MDINILRSIVTVVTFVIFLGIIWWPMSRRNQDDFDDVPQPSFRQED